MGPRGQGSAPPFPPFSLRGDWRSSSGRSPLLRKGRGVVSFSPFSRGKLERTTIVPSPPAQEDMEGNSLPFFSQGKEGTGNDELVVRKARSEFPEPRPIERFAHFVTPSFFAK